MRPSGKVIGMALAMMALFGVSWAAAEFTPVLHEHFEPDPKEDVELGVRVTAAGLPAAIQSPSGPVRLPSPTRPVDRRDPTYGERQNPAATHFRIDRETTDPGQLSYHEPFRPSIAPYKRTHVFDSVNAEFDLTVADPRLRPVTIGGAAGTQDDQFFGDLVLELSPGEQIRVPSVGPRMTVYSAHLEPETPFGFYVDRSENWFLRVPEGRGRMRLVMHVGVPRGVFDARIAASSYSALAPELPPVPANVEQTASELLQRLGISRVQTPAEALGRLVAHFRSFAESSNRPNATQGEALYRELVLSRKGVCRHRAYAFVVTALGLGIPSRFVHNEAHAWVEVFGGTHWHRIDLGGAASGIDYRGEPPEGPPHRPPAEAFPWPKRAHAAPQSLSSAGLSLPVPTGAGVTRSSSPQANTTADDRAASTSSSVSTATPVTEPLAKGSVRGRIVASLSTPSQVERGAELGVAGKIDAKAGNCSNVRIDVALTKQSQQFPLGHLVADREGRFSGKVVVPSNLPVGKYDLMVSTPGGKDCPAANSE